MTSNGTLNGSRYLMLKPWYLNEYNVSMIVLYVLVITSAIVGNILICSAVCINKKLHKNVASYFIVSLAIADLCTASFSMPFDLEAFITYGLWYHGKVWCRIWGTVYIIMVPISIWNLFVLSIDRYMMLKNPWDRFKASPFMTPRRALITIATLWIYCLTFALIPLMGWNFTPPLEHPYFCNFDADPNYAILTAFLNFFLPMFAMCFIYYKIYQIARTQYLMPTGLEAKPNSMPSRAAGNGPSKDDPREYQSMNSAQQQCYESCAGKGLTRKMEASGLSNLGLEIENGEKGNRNKTFIEDIENADNEINEIDHNQSADVNLGQDSRDKRMKIRDATSHEEEECREELAGNIEKYQTDLNQSAVDGIVQDTRDLVNIEDVTLHEEEKDHEEKDDEEVDKGNIREKATSASEQKRQSTNESILEYSHDENTKKRLENCNGSLCNVNEDDSGPSVSRQVEESQPEDTTEEASGENLFINENELKEENNAMGTSPELEEDTVRIPSMSKEYDIEDVCPSDREEHGSPNQPNHLPPQVTHTVSLEMQTYLRKQVLRNEDRGKSSSRESLQSNCTFQSTLPYGRDPMLERGGLSASRDTLDSAFGSMDDLTKKRKIFVKNKKAARTISIIVSAFLVCWIPSTTLSVVMNICQRKCHGPSTVIVSHVLLLLGYINSMLNPIIFSYQNVQFRISYRKMAKKLFPCFRIRIRN